MAKQGTYTAYQRLTPIQQDFGDDILKAEQMGFAYREEAAKRKKEIEDRNKEMMDDLADSASKLTPFDTKVQNVNTVVARAVERGRERLYEQYKIYSDMSKPYEERLKAKIAINELEKLPETLQLFTNGLTNYVTAQEKGIAEGNLLETPEYKNLNQVFKYTQDGKEMDLLLDKNNMPVLAYKDDQGAINKVSFADYMDKNLPSNVRNMDFDAMVKADSELMGTYKESIQKGYTTTTNVNPNEASLDALDKRTEKLFFIGENGRPSDALYSTLVSAGKNPYAATQEDVQQARELYKNRVLSIVDTEYSKTTDYNAMANMKRANKDDEKTAKGITVATYETNNKPYVSNISLSEVGPGEPSSVEGYVIINSADKTNTDFVIDEKGGIQTVADNVVVDKTGNYYATVRDVEKGSVKDPGFNSEEEFGVTTTTKTIKGKEKTRRLETEEVNALAVTRGYQNAAQMTKDIEKKLNDLGANVNFQSGVDEWGVRVKQK